MIYHLSLQTAGLIAGLFLLLVSVPGLIKPELARGFAQRLPRSRVAGFADQGVADRVVRRLPARRNAATERASSS